MKYTLDTNFLIYAVGNDIAAETFLENQLRRGGNTFFVPTIVIAEFLAYPQLKPRERRWFLEFVQGCETIPLDVAIAQRAGDIRRRHGVGLADSVIAATALEKRTTLVTRNIRDFKKVPHLKVAEI